MEWWWWLFLAPLRCDALMNPLNPFPFWRQNRIACIPSEGFGAELQWIEKRYSMIARLLLHYIYWWDLLRHRHVMMTPLVLRVLVRIGRTNHIGVWTHREPHDNLVWALTLFFEDVHSGSDFYDLYADYIRTSDVTRLQILSCLRLNQKSQPIDWRLACSQRQIIF